MGPKRGQTRLRSCLAPLASVPILGASARAALLDTIRFADLTLGLDWKAFLLHNEAEAETANIRFATSRGRPLASDTLLSKLDKRLNRGVRPLPVGPPKKVKRRMKTINRQTPPITGLSLYYAAEPQ